MFRRILAVWLLFAIANSVAVAAPVSRVQLKALSSLNLLPEKVSLSKGRMCFKEGVGDVQAAKKLVSSSKATKKKFIVIRTKTGTTTLKKAVQGIQKDALKLKRGGLRFSVLSLSKYKKTEALVKSLNTDLSSCQVLFDVPSSETPPPGEAIPPDDNSSPVPSPTASASPSLAPTQPPPVPGGVPSNLVAVAVSSSQINLTWWDNSTNEVGYRIESSLSSSGPWVEENFVTSNNTSYSVVGLAPSSLHYFRVKAALGGGVYGVSSNEVSATTLAGSSGGASPTPTPVFSPSPSPSPVASSTPLPVLAGLPSNLVATAAGPNTINLTWQSNSNTPTWIRIEFATSLNSNPQYTNWNELAPVPSTATSYTHTNICAGSTRYYRLTSAVPGYSSYQASAGIASATTASGSGCGATTPVPTPPPFSFTPPALTTPTNSLIIKESAGLTTNNYPVQIGRVFAQGEIPNYPQVIAGTTALTTQADVKTRWPDNSVKHAIISFLIPTLSSNSSVTITFQNQISGNNSGFQTQSAMLGANYNFNAIMQLTNGGTVSASARNMLQNGAFTYWNQGSVQTTIVIADHSVARPYDIGFGSSNSFRPIFHATFWPAINKVRVRYIGEIANTQAFQDQAYSLALLLGNTSPQTVYTKGMFTHIAGGRWIKEFWLGGAPSAIAINHNLTYLKSTGLAPNYDTTITIPSTRIATDYSTWLASKREIGEPGNLTIAMGAGGARPDIGPTTSWATQWLYTGDYRSREIAFGNADLSMFWPVHFREGQSNRFFDRAHTVNALGLPVSISGRLSIMLFNILSVSSSVNSPSDRIVPVGPVDDNGWIPDLAHEPDFWYYQYLLSGDYSYLEEMQFWASYTAAAFHPGNAQFARYGEEGLISNAFNIRGQAWPFRNRAQVAVASPDGSPEKDYFAKLTKNAISAWQGERGLAHTSGGTTSAYNRGTGVGSGNYGVGNTWIYTNSPSALFNIGYASPLHFWAYENQGLTSSSNVDQTQANSALANWMQSYMMYSLRRAQLLGFNNGNLVDWLAKNYIDQLTHPAYNHYLLTQYRTGTIDSNSVPFTNWDAVLNSYVPAAQAMTSYYDPVLAQYGYLYATDLYPNVHNAAISAAVGGTYDTASGLAAYQQWGNDYRWQPAVAPGGSPPQNAPAYNASFADPKWCIDP